MSKKNENIEELDKGLEGKGLNDLAQNVDLDKNSLEEMSQEFVDTRNYDKYDYYEFDRKKGTVKNYIIMFALYAIVIALVILLIIGFKYRKAPAQNSNNGNLETYETQN